MRHCLRCGCELSRYQLKRCAKCRGINETERREVRAKKKRKGRSGLKPIGPSRLMLGYNSDELNGSGKSTQDFSQRPCGMTEGTFTIVHRHKKPNAQ